MSSGANILKQAWYRWKALRLPWRRQRLVGVDLAGNTFWEFKDALNANRFRRIVRYPGLKHYADVRISPQWHQWLRHTRDAAPTVPEQRAELARQMRMKQLAFEADERWKSVPSYLDAPSRRQPAPAIGVQDQGGYAQPTTVPSEEERGVRSAVGDAGSEAGVSHEEEDGMTGRRIQTDEKETKRKKREENPWQRKESRGAPGEGWQPDAWSPGVAPRH